LKPTLKKQIDQLNKEKEMLKSDPKTLEKFAREKYWMKKKKEDIFILRKDSLK
jgi:cell division protein FtsB